MAEAREAATEEKLRLEQQARRGTIRKSYGFLSSAVLAAWADPAECFYAEAEDQAALGRVTLDRLSRPLEALLGAFESEGMAAAESLSERLEASRGRLEAFVKGIARDAVQHTLGLVKSHLLEANVDPVGDGILGDCLMADWEANHAAILEIAERIVADL